MKIEIREGTIEEIIQIYPEIPEFKNPHSKEEYEKRLFNADKYLLLIAYHENRPIGFKVGYEREKDSSFYSWMGGVAQAYRQHKVAQQLADYQEDWAKHQGYQKIKFKTRNSHKPMLIFALKNGFMIKEIESRESLGEYRILLEKEL